MLRKEFARLLQLERLQSLQGLIRAQDSEHHACCSVLLTSASTTEELGSRDGLGPLLLSASFLLWPLVVWLVIDNSYAVRLFCCRAARCPCTFRFDYDKR